MDDWSWPSRLADDPRRAWDCLKERDKEWLLRHPPRRREAVWILLHSQLAASKRIVRQLITAMPHGELLQDPAILRTCLKKNILDDVSLAVLLPTPSILLHRDLVVQILEGFPAFLRGPDLSPESKLFTNWDAFEAAVGGVLQSPSDADVLSRFSDTLRNNAELMLQALRFLDGAHRWSAPVPGRFDVCGPAVVRRQGVLLARCRGSVNNDDNNNINNSRSHQMRTSRTLATPR